MVLASQDFLEMDQSLSMSVLAPRGRGMVQRQKWYKWKLHEFSITVDQSKMRTRGMGSKNPLNFADLF